MRDMAEPAVVPWAGEPVREPCGGRAWSLWPVVDKRLVRAANQACKTLALMLQPNRPPPRASAPLPRPTRSLPATTGSRTLAGRAYIHLCSVDGFNI